MGMEEVFGKSVRKIGLWANNLQPLFSGPQRAPSDYERYVYLAGDAKVWKARVEDGTLM